MVPASRFELLTPRV